MEPTKEQKEKWEKEVEWKVVLRRKVQQTAHLILDAETEAEIKSKLAGGVKLPESIWRVDDSEAASAAYEVVSITRRT